MLAGRHVWGLGKQLHLGTFVSQLFGRIGRLLKKEFSYSRMDFITNRSICVVNRVLNEDRIGMSPQTDDELRGPNV